MCNYIIFLIHVKKNDINFFSITMKLDEIGKITQIKNIHFSENLSEILDI
jgi:hypothetical protein